MGIRFGEYLQRSSSRAQRTARAASRPCRRAARWAAQRADADLHLLLLEPEVVGAGARVRGAEVEMAHLALHAPGAAGAADVVDQVVLREGVDHLILRRLRAGVDVLVHRHEGGGVRVGAGVGRGLHRAHGGGLDHVLHAARARR